MSNLGTGSSHASLGYHRPGHTRAGNGTVNMPKRVRHGSGDTGFRPAKSGTQAGVESMETGMQLLLAFVALGGRGHMLKVIAEAAHMPSSKAHRYLVSLIRTGFVDRDPATGHYRLGPKAIQVGVSALGSIDAIALSGEEMVKLHDKLDHTMALTVWGSNSPVIVRVEEADRLMTVGFRIGKSLPLLASAAGQLFAAFLPRATIEPLLEQEIRSQRSRVGGRPIRSLAQAGRLLEEVRARGLSRIAGDITPGISALGAPVFDNRGYPATAIIAIGPSGAFDSDWDGPIAVAMQRHTTELSRKRGFTGHR